MSWDEYDEYNYECEDDYDDDLLILDVLDDMDESYVQTGRRNGGGCLTKVFWAALVVAIIGAVFKMLI